MNTLRLALIGGFALGAAVASAPANAAVDPFGTLTFTNLSGTSTLGSGNTLLADSVVTIPSGEIAPGVNNFFLQSTAGITYQGTV